MATGFVFTGLNPVNAEEVTNNFNLDEYVVTATRSENKIVDTPANISLITKDDFEKKNYQSVSQALEDVPGVIVKRSGFAGGDQHIFLNGDDRVLIMVDGRRLNQDKGTSGRSGFDITNLPSPDFIEKIEIVKGAGSALYGSDAVGGVINIITKNADKNYVKINVNAGSWNTQNYSTLISAKNDKTGIVVSASKQKQSYVKYKEASSDDNVKWPNSKNESTGATIKLTHDFDKDKELNLYFEHSFKEGGKPYYAPNTGSSVYMIDNGTDLNNNVSGKFIWGKDSGNKGFLQIYRNHYVGNFYRTYGNSNYYETKDGLEIQQNIQTSNNNDLIVGIDYRESEVNNPGTYGGKIAEIENKSIYLQNNWRIDDSWSLNAGARYDKHNYFGHETSLSLSLNKKFNNNSNAYISWGQVFNAPQANDLFYYSPGGPGYGAMLGNPDLKPETGETFTVGYNNQINEKTSIGINGFYSKLNDAMKWAPVDNSLDWTVSNVAEQEKRGMELNIKHKLDDNWSLNGSYAYVKVEENNKNGKGFVRDKNIAPNQYKLGVNYNKSKWNVELYGRGVSGADSSKYVDSKYLTMDFTAQYKPQNDYKIYLSIYNITNASYAETGGISNGNYQYPMPGRSFLVGMEYTF